MRYKQAMPRDVRALALCHVRGYDSRRRRMAERRDEAVLGTRSAAGAGQRTGGMAGSDVERRVLRAEQEADRTSVRAVETALSDVGADIRDEWVRAALREAVMRSCCQGREWPYERMMVPTVGRDDFYRRRNAFLARVARELGYL